MGINVNSNFTMGTSLPLDDRAVVADTTARDAIASGRRFDGLKVYVVSEAQEYQLQGGITNGDWEEAGGGSGGGGVTPTDTQDIAADGQITPNAEIQQFLKVAGDGGPQTANDEPFDTVPATGTIIILMGTSDTNTLTISYVDAAEGCLLKGDATLGLNDTLTLAYNLADQRYYEIARSID